MLDIFRRIGFLRRTPQFRRAARGVRLTVERLEGRDLPAPLAPTGLVATALSSSAIALTWDASPEPTVTGYDVYVVTTAGHPTHTVYTLVDSNLTTNSDTLTGVA